MSMLQKLSTSKAFENIFQIQVLFMVTWTMLSKPVFEGPRWRVFIISSISYFLTFPAFFFFLLVQLGFLLHIDPDFYWMLLTEVPDFFKSP